LQSHTQSYSLSCISYLSPCYHCCHIMLSLFGLIGMRFVSSRDWRDWWLVWGRGPDCEWYWWDRTARRSKFYWFMIGSGCMPQVVLLIHDGIGLHVAASIIDSWWNRVAHHSRFYKRLGRICPSVVWHTSSEYRYLMSASVECDCWAEWGWLLWEHEHMSLSLWCITFDMHTWHVGIEMYFLMLHGIVIFMTSYAYWHVGIEMYFPHASW